MYGGHWRGATGEMALVIGHSAHSGASTAIVLGLVSLRRRRYRPQPRVASGASAPWDE